MFMSRTSCYVVIFVVTVVALIAASLTRSAFAHCEMPCGIYDDPLRVQMLREDAVTINKAMEQIVLVTAAHDHEKVSPLALNQIARWVSVKEDAAQNIQDAIANYFLTQRVQAVDPGKEGYDAYIKKLTTNHAVLVAAMKCKQNVDTKYAVQLLGAVEAMSPYYTTVYPALQQTEGNESDATHDDHDHDHDHGGHSH